MITSDRTDEITSGRSAHYSAAGHRLHHDGHRSLTALPQALLHFYGYAAIPMFPGPSSYYDSRFRRPSCLDYFSSRDYISFMCRLS
jgi:hypothetical protein